MADQAAGDFVLGIDLGTNSVGWAIVGLVDGEPAKLIRAGVRVFEAGMEGDIESGREESRNLKRRQMRLQRRQTWRRARRLKRVFRLLQNFGLLPPCGVELRSTRSPGAPPQEDGDHPSPDGSPLHERDARQDLLNRLDQEILHSAWFAAKQNGDSIKEPQQVLPYLLRAAALDEKLEPHYLGRAFYHLAQRRGFLSNRKAAPKKDDDEGAVKEGISELRRKMQETKARTLGEYFSRASPSDERIRSRWTARDMYEKEFDAICGAQAVHHPGLLTDDRRKELRKAVFFQRPLWFDPNTIGKCELEPDERRAPMYLLLSQRFRLLQAVNNLRLLPPGETETPLTSSDGKKLIDELELKGDLKFDKIRKLLGLEKEYVFTLERGGEKTLKGNRTNADFGKVFGELWGKMTPEERDRAVEYVHAFQRPDKLREAAKKHFGLDDNAAVRLSELTLEPDYINHSRKAIEKLLPLLEQGMTYGEARKQAYPESFTSGEAKPLLPWVEQALTEIRNPAVMRSLTELRKVVNAILRQHGKPQQIRIELARDLKKSKKRRAADIKRNRENQATREKAAKKIDDISGDQHPSRDDIRRVQLFDDCRGQCVYCGQSIAARNFLGKESQVDLDHIIPFSRSLDDSYANLVICHAQCNRAKGNRTPFEAYSGNSELYAQIVDRVKQFAGDRRTLSEKLKRFQMDDEQLEAFLGDFRHRQLNDTAYATRLAADYLGLLYGGRTDQQGNLRVQATSGQSTYRLRGLWKLNSILNDGPTANGGRDEKKRTDHRHHAIDALVTGLTDAGMMKRLSDAAKRGLDLGRRFGSLDAPWPNFVDSIRAEIHKIVVSHRVSKKVSGALHEETIYSRPFAVAPVYDRRPGNRRSQSGATAPTAATVNKVRVRKPLAALSKTEVGDIADPKVKELVTKKLEELGGDPKKFSDEKNLPRFPTSGVLIRRVRVNKPIQPTEIGDGRRRRHVELGSNHHIEIFSVHDKKGREMWDGEVVSMFEAHQRVRNHKPVVEKNHGPEAEFEFSLAAGEVIECDGKSGSRDLFVMRKVTQFTHGGIQIGFAPLNDARQAREMQIKRAWLWATPDTLRERHARKVVVSPLGDWKYEDEAKQAAAGGAGIA